MKICTEKSLREFNFWNGAKDTVKYLTEEEIDQIKAQLEELYPEGMDETAINDLINDFFWAENNTIAKCLFNDSLEDIMDRGSEEEEK